MVASNMTASNLGRIEQSRAKPEDVHCPPMTHQNSGDHGHEMHPQQFVRLVGCHNAPADVSRKHADEKLH
ncbi:hypothetical protein ABID59_000861 [Bradyrhizobium sp. S3.3.6]|uniref:Uncharacterized protein n=1 Tax=Bradyrhizobium cytisi TaxID=515489 RepID=A0A5S4WQR0_9BRAD|nr:hypothetical protein [Bradyrhizobium cytisi]TYL84279.1 hypothetical protein FXB38_15645 [Bradyrhizobium cytisi]